MLGKDVLGFRQRAISLHRWGLIGVRLLGLSLSHGSAPLARSARCSGFRERSVCFVLPPPSVSKSQLIVPCGGADPSVYSPDIPRSTLYLSLSSEGCHQSQSAPGDTVIAPHANCYRAYSLEWGFTAVGLVRKTSSLLRQ